MSARDDYPLLAALADATLREPEYAIVLDEIDRLRTALEFYADPDTYFACGFWFDRPTGGFDEDFDEDHGGNYDRAMPGKFARQALREPLLPSREVSR